VRTSWEKHSSFDLSNIERVLRRGGAGGGLNIYWHTVIGVWGVANG
jgi:hypothetical protein